MRKIHLFFILLTATLTGCSTHLIDLDYANSGISSKREATIANVTVIDRRGTDTNWLGAIRGGYGNRLKTLRTSTSTDVAIRGVYESALSENGILSRDTNAPYALNVTINKFDCSYYFNREAHSNLEISVTRKSNNEIILRKNYKSDDVEPGVGAGIFGSVETLAELAEKSLSNAINKMLLDPEFINAIEKPSQNTSQQAASNYSLNSLGKEKLTYEEYQRRYREITQTRQSQ